MFGSGLGWEIWEKKIPLLGGSKKNNQEEENLVSLLKRKLGVFVPIVRARGAAAASQEQRGADAKRLAPVPDLMALVPPPFSHSSLYLYI